MYCRCCGKEMADNASICMNCGVPVGKGKNYCPSCGETTNPEAVMCVKCGGGLVWQEPTLENKGTKSSIVAGLLGIFLGSLGVHNFYLGFTKRAVAQLALTLVGAFGWIVFVIIAGLSGMNEWGALGIAVLSIFISIPMIIISGIWALVEGIMLLCGAKKTDGKGNPLKD